jgi:hypothetical protein
MNCNTGDVKGMVTASTKICRCVLSSVMGVKIRALNRLVGQSNAKLVCLKTMKICFEDFVHCEED